MVSPVQVGPESLPSLLQAVIVFWDHYTSLVQMQAREMLVHLIHELVISKLESVGTTVDKRTIEDLAECIRKNDMKIIWAYEDKGDEEDNSETNVPSTMQYLIAKVVNLFSINYPSVREDWGKTTIMWATSCPVRHLAYRSFQIFRCLQTPIDQQMLSGVLARLSNTVSDDETDILIFSLEILTTLKAIVKALDSNEILKYPQLFWTACACLSTIHEREFMSTLSLLECLITKLDLSDPAVIKMLKDRQPEKWKGSFRGIQYLLHKGVRSAACLDETIKLLEHFAIIPSSELTGDATRICIVVLANLPRYLRSFQDEHRESSITASAKTLGQISESHGWNNLSSTLTYFAQGRYRMEKDFLGQVITALQLHFFPESEFEALTFLLGTLTNQLAWFKHKVMDILCVVIPDIDLRKSEYSSQGPDLISPLLRLLQTEFCPQALKVLDNVMTMTGTPMDKHHLRMSMIGAHSSKAARKEYAETQCLYGIPEESGWSVPMPALHAADTRNNVHAVFYTCATAQTASQGEMGTENVNFHGEDEAYPLNSSTISRTMTTFDDSQKDGNMGDLVNKLDSLDDFFEDDTSIDTKSIPNSKVYVKRNSLARNDTRESIYDEQTLPILHRTLQQNINNDISQSEYDESKTLVQSQATSPAFFSTVGASTKVNVLSRSITSPATPQEEHPFSTGILAMEGQEDIFSDDETSIARAPLVDRSFSIETMIKPFQGTRSGIRSGMRRLTGGTADGKEEKRIKDLVRTQMQLQKSPKVPKVPDQYLHGSNKDNASS